MKKDSRFTEFVGWGKEYFAATIAYKDRFGLIEYIKNQEGHHLKEDVDTEFKILYERESLVMYESDLD